MANSVLSDTAAWDTAAELRGVTKCFSQRQNTQNVLKNLFHPTYRTVTALDQVDLCIRRGEFVAYAGPNGAGKSTTFKLLCGMLSPNRGTLRTLGLDPVRQRIALMKQLGILFGNRSELWWDHPVCTSFEWKKQVWDIPEEVYQRQLHLACEMLDLKPFWNTFARELSLGQRMRADLGLLLLHDPALILLDEPTLGLDVLAKRQMIDTLKTLNRDFGATILVTSHDLDDLTEMAQRLVMLAQGSIVFDGAPDGLRAIAGDSRTLTLTCADPAPQVPGATLSHSEGERHTYLFDHQALSTSNLLQAIGQLPQVTDVELGRAPIEQVIAGLYQKWKQPAAPGDPK
ncbi:MAG: ATP-binding cassette domain-containing protein [Eubacteriales bacterium]|nr:ATP-binding cassette domain-containing protein [Eubacteriales bacterium]